MLCYTQIKRIRGLTDRVKPLLLWWQECYQFMPFFVVEYAHIAAHIGNAEFAHSQRMSLYERSFFFPDHPNDLSSFTLVDQQAVTLFCTPLGVSSQA
jgi:hypothetical protein